MKTRTYIPTSSQKNDKMNSYMWKAFLIFTILPVGFIWMIDYWMVWFLCVSWIYICILLLYRYKTQKSNYSFNYTQEKTREWTTVMNHLNSHNYYKNNRIIQEIQKKLWKEIYYDKYLLSLGIIAWWIFIYFTIFIGFLGGLLKHINDILAIIMFVIIPITLLIWWHFHYKHKYKSIIKNPWNRYLIENIQTKSYKFSKQMNAIEGEDFIFQKYTKN